MLDRLMAMRGPRRELQRRDLALVDYLSTECRRRRASVADLDRRQLVFLNFAASSEPEVAFPGL
jgi:hypothetical protein